MEARKEDSLAVEPIDAQAEFEAEYGNNPATIARFDQKWKAHLRSMRRRNRIRALWKGATERFSSSVAAARRRPRNP